MINDCRQINDWDKWLHDGYQGPRFLFLSVLITSITPVYNTQSRHNIIVVDPVEFWSYFNKRDCFKVHRGDRRSKSSSVKDSRLAPASGPILESVVGVLLWLSSLPRSHSGSLCACKQNWPTSNWRRIWRELYETEVWNDFYGGTIIVVV